MRNRGFTLLEVVLAIGLAGAVLGLLTTALDLYLVRVDASRTQVETAQLARTLLNQIASDLRAVRYYSPAATAGSGSPEIDSSAATGAAAQQGAAASQGMTPVQGIFGSATELRIDRSAPWRWDYQTRLVDASNTGGEAGTAPSQAVMPQTVRYLLGEGKELLADEFAAAGVGSERIASGYGGLYRQQIATVAWLAEQSISSSMLPNGDTENAEFIAPEVIDLSFAYCNGGQLYTEWDSGLEQGLPQAIEIRLTLLQERFEQAATRTTSDRDALRRNLDNLTQYRLVVSLSHLQEPHPAEFPQPLSSDQQPPGSRSP
jgi:type II secretory pathway pseudopilin PulG